MTKADKRTLTASERLAKTQLVFAKLTRDFETSTRRHNPIVAKCIRAGSSALQSASANLFSDELDAANESLDLSSIYIVFARQLVDSDEIEATMGEGDYLELTQVKPEDELAEAFDSLRTRI